MQPEAHSIENVQNSREVWLSFTACKRTMNVRPRKPRFLRKFRNIVQTGGCGNGVTNPGDIRLLKRLIYAVGCSVPLVRL
jgi:hypothetical protein